MIIKRRLNLVDFFNERKYRFGAEIGVWKGGFSSSILSRCAVDKMICVDPWNGVGMTSEFDGDEVYEEAKAALNAFGARVQIVRKTSIEAANDVDDGSLDFVYIDALHMYDEVKKDIEAWLPKVRSGGILAGHDYKKKRMCGVKRAVDEFFGEENVSHTVRKLAPSWWVFV